jgi:hypothetical protein
MAFLTVVNSRTAIACFFRDGIRHAYRIASAARQANNAASHVDRAYARCKATAPFFD